MYDPKTDTWTLVADMAVGRKAFAVALIHRPNTNLTQTQQVNPGHRKPGTRRGRGEPRGGRPEAARGQGDEGRGVKRSSPSIGGAMKVSRRGK